MKKSLLITSIIAGIFTSIFLCTKFYTPSGPMPLRLLKAEERHRTVERTLTKKTELESQMYSEEYKVKLECTFAEMHYEYAPYLKYVIELCKDKSDQIYTPLSLETVQTCVAQRTGFNKTIVPITGMTLEDEDSCCVLRQGQDEREERSSDIFYLNIPIDMVEFLNKIEATLHTDTLMRETISQEDIVQYNLINALIHGGLRIISEMDSSKPHVCAYRLKSLDDVNVEYEVTDNAE